MPEKELLRASAISETAHVDMGSVVSGMNLPLNATGHQPVVARNGVLQGFISGLVALVDTLVETVPFKRLETP